MRLRSVFRRESVDSLSLVASLGLSSNGTLRRISNEPRQLLDRVELLLMVRKRCGSSAPLEPVRFELALEPAWP